MTAHFAIVDGTDALYLAKEDAPGVGIRLASAVGTRLPAELTAVGKANLAFVTGSLADSRPALAGELAQLRSQGFAVDEGQILTAVRCIAAPVFDHRQEVALIIALHPLRALTTRRIRSIGERLVGEAALFTPAWKA